LLSNRAEVLVGGGRCPIAGRVTMDQIMIDCGDADIATGDEVVLIGRQGDDEITADEIANDIGTINYEVVTAVGPRVPRRYAQ
jgi:alanine racemase